MDLQTLTEVLTRHLLTVLKPVDFDIVQSAAGGELDVAADKWTIHFENGTGFLAIDSEPDEPAAYTTARREVMSEAIERAIATADHELDGALSAALVASGDPFTLNFVAALRQTA